MPPRDRDLHLGMELLELANALDAARLLSDCQRTRSLSGPEDERAAARAVAATLGLVVERLRVVATSLHGEAARAGRPRPRDGKPR